MYRRFLPLLGLAACGGSTPAPESPDPAPSDHPAVAGDPAPVRDEGGASLAERREGFLNECGKSMPNADDYCRCSWDLLSSLLSEQEIASDSADRSKLEAFKQQVGPKCAAKIPEEVVERSFFEGCVSGKEGMDDYCKCSYKVLRKHVAAADLATAGNDKTPKFLEAKKNAVAECRGQIHEDAVQAGFMQGCAKDDPTLQSFCGCAWKQLRETVSPADIVTGQADIDGAQPGIEKACGKLRPAH